MVIWDRNFFKKARILNLILEYHQNDIIIDPDSKLPLMGLITLKVYIF